MYNATHSAMNLAATATWEQHLLNQAYRALHSEPLRDCDDLTVDPEALAHAYSVCTEVTRAHSRTFFLASGLLPPVKRRAARALYAFCRISDDLVDQGEGDTLDRLERWRRRAVRDCPSDETSTEETIALAWADTQARYRIPGLYADQLLDGVKQDLTQQRYATFAELSTYCYGVASTVGLMAMHIVGFDGPEAVPEAVKLGVALQLTNILRDIGEDWARGRLYLPQDELARFEVTEEDVATGRVDDRWRGLMRFQIARVRRLYAESLPGVRRLHRDGRFAIGAAAELYRAILEDIEAHDMQVFDRRSYVSAWGKLRRLPGIWWRANVTQYAGADKRRKRSEEVSV